MCSGEGIGAGEGSDPCIWDLISHQSQGDAAGMQHALAPAPSLGQVNPAGTETHWHCVLMAKSWEQ